VRKDKGRVINPPVLQSEFLRNSSLVANYEFSLFD
jgi:hypothetical protein